MSLQKHSAFKEIKQKTVLVFAADRGHFVSCVPLAKELRRRGFTNIVLWTHSLTREWYPKGTFDSVIEKLGSGNELNQMVRLYKQSVSLGDGDNESLAAMLQNFPQLLKDAGLSFERISDYMVQDDGKEAFSTYLTDNPVAIVVWEETFCKWVADICGKKRIPSFGLVPSPYHIFRCHYSKTTNTEMLDWTGRSAIRDIEKEPDPVSDKHPYGHMISKILLQGATIRSNAIRFGAFLPASIEKEEASNTGDDSISSWLGLSKEPVVVISLGSQSALSSLGDSASAILISGALQSNLRVLFTGEKPDNALLDENVTNDRLYCAASIPQWKVLNHPNVKMFLTHCGLNSTHEGLFAGVAMIPLPFFDDQYYIAESLEKLYGYANDKTYSPLRKSDLRPLKSYNDTELAAHYKSTRTKIANALQVALNLPQEKLQELSDVVVEENGVRTAGDVIEKLACMQ